MKVTFHTTHETAGDVFPLIDNRDIDETWIWVNPTTHIRIMTKEFIEMVVENNGTSIDGLIDELWSN
jgi:hypothetical protein